ncbi:MULTISPECIES: SdpI family protein [Flavobacteriales]|uniref:SdpI family protein n=1 Tax=Flavobacteriales TaxID=200644 RepID=UPI000837C97D|nr:MULTISPECIES: SdpI family protein [Flavobacteriales]MDK7375600.1 SdpI family protein [Weeksella virosa]OFM84014.1 hypothetical protein HMPREF2660_09545 [Weeksella sp. HMSC059D05]
MLQTGIIESLIFLAITILYFVFQPKSRNGIYGYRTPLSKKSDKHWVIANKLASKILLFSSIFIFIISVIMKYALDKNPRGIFLVLLLISFVMTFLMVEKKLRSL